MTLLARFSEALRGLAVADGDTVIVAVSGGPDSLAMLHLFTQVAARRALHLVAVHVHHGIRGAAADADAEFVRSIADAWGVRCRIETCDVPALAQLRRWSLETAARRARYSALAQAAKEESAGVIAVGHHQDDQAETILMHILRGSGLDGLRGMQMVSPLADSHVVDPDPEMGDLMLIRPLLGITRVEIEAYCAEHGLEARIDQTNRDTALRRNRLRHEVMPVLRAINPQVGAGLARLAEIVSGDMDYLAEQETEGWKAYAVEMEEGITFPREGWHDLPVALQRRLLRRAALMVAPADTEIGFEQVDAALRMLVDGDVGQMAMMPGGVRVRVRYEDILITREGVVETRPDWPLLAEGASIRVSNPGRIAVGDGGWVFEIEPYTGPRVGSEWAAVLADPWQAVLGEGLTFPLQLRTRQPGDRFYPQGAGGSQKVSDFQINTRIPAEWRDQLPVLVSGDEIAWLCGWRVDERYVVSVKDGAVWIASFRNEKGPS